MPDLNTVPASPHTLVNSRRQSSQQLNAQANPPDPSLNILPSNQNAVNQTSSSVSSPQLAATQPVAAQLPAADPAVGGGPGPSRHPRPITASELHTQLEKEQEAVVNRLTRELSLLRAQQNASVVSNTSSTSATTPTHESIPEPSLLSGSGFSIPTSRRHHRQSSSASQSSAAQPGSSYDNGIHAPRPTHHHPAPVTLSRQNSSTSRRSRNASPAPPSSLDPSSYFHQQRVPPPPTTISSGAVGITPGSASHNEQLSPGMLPATSRYEETVHHRNELETAKRENDSLKRRIRDLEKMVREKRDTDASRPRSESASTAASVNVAPSGGAGITGPRDVGVTHQRPTGRERGLTSQSIASATGSVGVGVPEDEVQVGESAATSGRPGDIK